MTHAERFKNMESALRAILKHRPKEICYDEFAYKRLVSAYREAAKEGLEK